MIAVEFHDAPNQTFYALIEYLEFLDLGNLIDQNLVLRLVEYFGDFFHF